MSAPGLWQLEARTAQLAAGGDGWRALARAAAAVGQRLRGATDPLATSWRGLSTDAYYRHRTRVLDLAGTVSTVADAIAGTLEAAVGALTSGQAHLDDSWLRLTRAVPGLRGFGFPVEVLALSATAGPAGDAVRAAIAEAHDIRDHVDGRLSGYATELGRHRLRLQAAMRTLALYVTPWLRPDELSSPGAILIDGDRIIVNGTGGADIINVRTDPDTDDLLVDVNGVVSRFPPGVKLVVRGGDGDDRITLDTPTRLAVDLYGSIATAQVHPAPDITVLAGLPATTWSTAATATTRCTGWRATTSSRVGAGSTTCPAATTTTTSTAGTAATSSPAAATTTSCTGWRATTGSGAARGRTTSTAASGPTWSPVAVATTRCSAAGATTPCSAGTATTGSTAARAPTGWPAGRAPTTARTPSPTTT